MASEVSHGRGGAGNMRNDDMEYVDASIVRAGEEGSHGDGAYSAGRGGAGNIGDIGTPTSERKDIDLVPEQAVRLPDEEDHHTGRGGAGNEQCGPKRAESTTPPPVGLADKLKAKILGLLKKKE